MKKYRKHWILYLLTLSLILLCVGCGGKADEHTGEAKIPEEASELEGMNYKEVQKMFKEAGFTNIELERLDDLITGWLNEEGEVKEVLINGDTEYTKASWVSNDTPVVIRYHTFKEETNSSEEQQSGNEKQKKQSTEKTAPVENEKTEVKDEIIMPYSSEEYLNEEWSTEGLSNHFKEIGFDKIEIIPSDPNDDNYKKEILGLYIEGKKLLDKNVNKWEKGDSFKSTSTINIYINKYPVLTIDNCQDLQMVLTGNEIDYMTFAEQYDGRYVEFNAYVIQHLTYNGTLDHIIDVAGYISNDDQNSSPIRIEKAWSSNVDESVVIGDYVHVEGKIWKYKTEYYKEICIKTFEMTRIW